MSIPGASTNQHMGICIWSNDPLQRLEILMLAVAVLHLNASKHIFGISDVIKVIISSCADGRNKSLSSDVHA